MAGPRDVEALADLARGRLRTKRHQLTEALQGYSLNLSRFVGGQSLVKR
jgi:hypothetical protein